MTIKETKPLHFTISGPNARVFKELPVHLLNGYVIAETGVEVFASTGQVFIHLVQGEPSVDAVADATASLDLALALEEAQSTRSAETEAKRIATEAKATSLRELLAEQVAAHAKSLKKIKQQIAAL